MNTAILIAARELRDRSRLFLVAGVMGLAPFLAVLALREDRQRGMAVVAGFLAIAYAASLALMFGVSTIGRELAEKRLAFLFSAPVSPAAIWLGKTASALFTCLVGFAIIVLPTYLLAHDAWSEAWPAHDASAAAVFGIGLCAALFFGGHVASTMLRSRSVRVVLDLVLLLVALGVVGALLHLLLIGGAGGAAARVIVGIGGALLAMFVVAPVWQLARGRVDPKRHHAALSTVIWSGMAGAIAIAAAYVFWVISPPLSRLTEVYELDQSTDGAWVFVSGLAPGGPSYMASYLVETATGEREHVALPPMSHPQFSADGRLVAWWQDTALFPHASTARQDTRDFLMELEKRKGHGAFRLHTRRLKRGAKAEATSLILPMPHLYQLSQDGSRLATATGTRIEVYEVASGRLLAAAEGVTAWQIVSMFFAGPDVLRVVDGANEVRRFRELDIAHRALHTVEKSSSEHFRGLNVTGDGAQIYLKDEAVVVDARTGETLRTLPVQPANAYRAAMLDDGSVIVTRDHKLFRIGVDGRVVAEVPIPILAGSIVGQIGASKIWLSADDRQVVVDLATKKIVANVTGISSPFLGRRAVVPRFVEDATFVGLDRERRYGLWDVTGAKRPFPA
jgi:hypothetical protein